MDPATPQPTGNVLVGDQNTTQTPPVVNLSAPTDHSLLEKINSHQFDNVTQSDINFNKPLSQRPTDQQNIDFTETASNSIETKPAFQSAQSTKSFVPPAPYTKPIDTLQSIFPSSSTLPNIDQNSISTQKEVQTLTQPVVAAPVQIEYPNPIVQQQSTRLTPTLPQSIFPADISLPSQAEIPKNIQPSLAPNHTSLPQFGSPYPSISQEVIPPLQPVINQPTSTTNPPQILPTPTITQPQATAAPEMATSQNTPVTTDSVNQTQPAAQTSATPPSSEQSGLSINPQRFEKKRTLSLVVRVTQTITTVILTFQGLRGLYSSLHFIIIEFPIFEQALNEHQLGEETVNTFAIKAGLMILSTAVSLFFAVQLAIFHSKTIKILNIFTGIFLMYIVYHWSVHHTQ